MAVPGSGVAATLPSRAAFGASSSGVPQVGAILRSPASRWQGSRMASIKATHSSSNEGWMGMQSRVPKSKVVVTLVALALTAAPVSPAHAGLFGSSDDHVKVDQRGTEGSRLNTSSGDAVKKVNPLGDTVRRKVAGVKDMAENARSTVTDDLPTAPSTASTTPTSR